MGGLRTVNTCSSGWTWPDFCSCIVPMNAKSKSSKGYAVFTDVLRPLGQRLSVEEAFHLVLAQCGYEPIWRTETTRMTLCFRYLDAPPSGLPVRDLAFESPLNFGAWAARGQIMQQVLNARLKGWRGVNMDSFYTLSSIAQHELRSTCAIEAGPTSGGLH
jgi:hypothetical protein